MAQKQLLTALSDMLMDDAVEPSSLAMALASPPFVTVPGAFNVRNLACGPGLRPGLIYRSGSPAGLTAEGINILANELKVKTIFDLRSAGEKKSFPLSSFEENDAIKIISLDYDKAPIGMDIADFIPRPEDTNVWNGGARGFSKDYLEILDIYHTAFRDVLRYLIDHPNSPILFNCTAGKDRTGVLAALILSLAGAADEDIAFDYALSRIGIEPQKDFLHAIVKKWKPEWNDNTPGFKEFSNVRSEYMLQFLEDARREYGGHWAMRYARVELGFSRDDIETLLSNLKQE